MSTDHRPRQVRDKELYNDLDTEVKRQIWTDHQTLFGDEVSPLFIQYVQQKEAALLTHTNLSNFFDLTPKVGWTSRPPPPPPPRRRSCW